MVKDRPAPREKGPTREKLKPELEALDGRRGD